VPRSGKPEELALPKVERFSLKNGLEVIVVPRKELPIATFSLSIEAGGYDESRDMLGVSDFVAAMLRRGTKTRSADDISRSYADAVAAAGKPAVALSLPGVHEDALALVDAGVRAATRFVREASFLRRETVSMTELCVAVECGHSDATSGLVCNPLAGRLMERLVAGGGTEHEQGESNEKRDSSPPGQLH